jgi:hypothetical protein
MLNLGGVYSVVARVGVGKDVRLTGTTGGLPMIWKSSKSWGVYYSVVGLQTEGPVPRLKLDSDFSEYDSGYDRVAPTFPRLVGQRFPFP